ncbi:MAG: gliding motility-associated ABC transporter substrate-binding protein GldG [Paludibacteraceae bacterium]
MKVHYGIIGIAGIILINILVQLCVVRLDMTEDKRYSLSEPTKRLLRQTDSPVEVTLYLDGDLNAGFRRLKKATEEIVDELGIYADVRFHVFDASEENIPQQLSPIVIHERQKDGKTAQTTVYPYASVRYGGRNRVIPLLKNNRGLSGEENLNISIENLEYAFAEALHSLLQTDTAKIAFIEGHGELPEQNVYDLTSSLSRYFDIDRGVLGAAPHVLDPYKVVIIADPQGKFSDSDKYILDQYVMRGGRILWVLNGVQFSEQVLSEEGFTPVLPLELNLTDMFFRYGVRINPALVQDVQCLPIPVNVSTDPQQPNLQPMPWYYAPLLLTSQASPITRNIGQVSCTFASPIDIVGGEDGIHKEILLATSTASRLIGTPAEVDLADLNPDMQTFTYQYIPIAYSLEGEFPSAFAHRMVPEGIDSHEPILTKSSMTKQIVVGSGSIIRNDIQQGEALPLGYDRYSGMQFSNRDFLTNAILYLSDDEGLISLREKNVVLRLLNDKRAYQNRTSIQLISTISPILLLGIAGMFFIVIRKRKYTR